MIRLALAAALLMAGTAQAAEPSMISRLKGKAQVITVALNTPGPAVAMRSSISGTGNSFSANDLLGFTPPRGSVLVKVGCSARDVAYEVSGQRNSVDGVVLRPGCYAYRVAR